MRRRTRDKASEQSADANAKTSRLNAEYSETLHVLFPEANFAPCVVSDWVHLNQGQRIIVQRDMEYPKAGTIDLVSEDAFNSWVWLDQGEGRALVSSQENVTVWKFGIHGDGTARLR